MHDAMTLENRGVPTVVLCTDPFLNSAFRHANTFGRKDFRPLGFPHPLGGLKPEAGGGPGPRTGAGGHRDADDVLAV